MGDNRVSYNLSYLFFTMSRTYVGTRSDRNYCGTSRRHCPDCIRCASLRVGYSLIYFTVRTTATATAAAAVLAKTQASIRE